MRFRLAIVLCAALALCTGASFAAIGWANYQWPCNGASYADNQNIDIYTQAWKGGCTDSPGACADLSVTIYYKRASEGSYTAAPMSYLGDVGSNDEYTFQIPAASTTAGDPEEYYIVWHDASDASDYNPADHCGGGNVPPMVLYITPATSRDVIVHFSIDVSCLPEELTQAMFVAGDFQGWSACNPGNQMTVAGNRLYVGNLSFPAGSNPYHEYKFNRLGAPDGCQWENAIGNRSFIIDDSGPEQYLPTVQWDNWDCCLTDGPAEITGAGSYCVSLCVCPQALSIPLNTGYAVPLLYGVSFGFGCSYEITNCDAVCEPGAGDVQWGTRQDGDGHWYLDLCLTDNASAHPGCFCMTIDQILPVELGSFDAIAGDGEVLLNWNTRSEDNNARFDIERDGSVIEQIPSLGNSASGHRYSWTDRNVVNGQTYHYTLYSVDLNGARAELSSTEATPRDAAELAGEYRLEQNYPNPFNPATSISYSIPEAGFVTLSVYDLSGRVVATLVNGEVGAGSYSVNFSGDNLPSGIYYYRLSANGFSATHKMVLMK